MASSYFSTPSDHLDPALFDGDHLKDDVRGGLLDTLYTSLEKDVHLKAPWSWVNAWLAGSGVSYQWEADRGNGDLDILFGVDYPQFLSDNPQFPKLSKRDTAAYVDDVLKSTLWARTANYKIHGKTFEATFFWNADTSSTLAYIKPYAAYNLTTDTWDVKPPKLPANPGSLYPQSWYDQADMDYQAASAARDTNHVLEARQLWSDIHGKRSEAFSEMGFGYSDRRNFRWQRAKELGTVDILRGMEDNSDEADKAAQESLYGRSLDGASAIITRAALRYGSPRYSG